MANCRYVTSIHLYLVTINPRKTTKKQLRYRRQTHLLLTPPEIYIARGSFPFLRNAYEKVYATFIRAVSDCKAGCFWFSSSATYRPNFGRHPYIFMCTFGFGQPFHPPHPHDDELYAKPKDLRSRHPMNELSREETLKKKKKERVKDAVSYSLVGF
ncbi:hypothetical protein CDAR_85091 [Caerostris darwini]|uniref:Uncharacterized protein n=1 Tax=Caerostris darwini TaxID=1538125 RepID=A0AAV4MZ42_9ARAC|nr:hypothetical protein CDAR_85091 [Caerostris darwini]